MDQTLQPTARLRIASLARTRPAQIDNKEEYVSIDNGVIFFVCFLKNAENDDLKAIVESLLAAKMHTGALRASAVRSLC